MASVAGSAGLSCVESPWKGRTLPRLGNGNAFIKPSRFKFFNTRKKSTTLVIAAKSPADKIPKQFREENLKEGVKENFKTFPTHLYGLSPSQLLSSFSTEDSPVERQAEQVTEESLPSQKCDMERSGMQNLANLQSEPSEEDTSLGSFQREGGLNHTPDSPSRTKSSEKMQSERPEEQFSLGSFLGLKDFHREPELPPPDLPSYMLASRVVFIGMPLIPAVVELVFAELLYLDSEGPEPIYLYLNSPGTQTVTGERIASDSEAFLIADALGLLRCKVYTFNLGMAFGLAAMLLGLGHPGCRYVMPRSFTRIDLPGVNQSVGPSIDLYLQANELEMNTDSYISYLSIGTGKSREEIIHDLRKRTKLFCGQQAIDYGLADKIMHRDDNMLGKEPPQTWKKHSSLLPGEVRGDWPRAPMTRA